MNKDEHTQHRTVGRPYQPTHAVTDNYANGMCAIADGKLDLAFNTLIAEPQDSPCYGLAHANAGLTLLRLERYQEAETQSSLALQEFDRNGCPHPPTAVQTKRNLAESVARQGREVESLGVFKLACELADELSQDYPNHAVDLELEKAHTLNSWGGSLLKLLQPEGAINCFADAREIYRRHPANLVGCAETLTNLAQAYHVAGESTKAKLALEEARQIAQSDKEQLFRVEIAWLRLGFSTDIEAEQSLKEAADDAERRGFFDTAHLRLCISAHLADKHNNSDWGLRAVKMAEALESKLPQESLHPAKLRFYKATFIERSGQAQQDVIRVLLEGARMWCERIPGKMRLADYQAATEMMHDHFRLLARRLLDANRCLDAYIAFETGRARAFAAEISPNFSHPLTIATPFSVDGNVDHSLLNTLQSKLKSDEVVVSLAILPPKLVAFIVSRDGLATREMALVSDVGSAKSFRESLEALPSRLACGKGFASIPSELSEFAKVIAEAIQKKKIQALSPHSVLHTVPWRVLFREIGLNWNQLEFANYFNPLFTNRAENIDETSLQECSALGHGNTGSLSAIVNLEDEAREFAHRFAASGKFVSKATSHNLTTALESQSVVLISCHGLLADTSLGKRFVFQLGDGSFFPWEVLPDRINAPLVILSACDSGAYDVALGDYPVGVAPLVIARGAGFCICSRFPLSAHFSRELFPYFADRLLDLKNVEQAFVRSLEYAEQKGYDRWSHIACIELIGRGA